MTDTSHNQECCPVFDPEPWDSRTHEWTEKPFIRKTIPQFLHMPLPGIYAKVLGAMWKMAQEAEAAPEIKDFLLLAWDPSPWKSELYMSVKKEVPGAENIKMTGKFITRVFDGPYNHVPKYLAEFNNYLDQKELKAKRYFFYFTTCPKCAKKHGHNYIVGFAEL